MPHWCRDPQFVNEQHMLLAVSKPDSITGQMVGIRLPVSIELHEVVLNEDGNFEFWGKILG